MDFTKSDPHYSKYDFNPNVTNEHKVNFVLLKDGDYSKRVKKLPVGQVSNVLRCNLAFRIGRITNLEPDSPYTAVLYVGDPSESVSRLCFKTAADPNIDIGSEGIING